MDSKLESPNSMSGRWKLEEEKYKKIMKLYMLPKHKKPELNSAQILETLA